MRYRIEAQVCSVVIVHPHQDKATLLAYLYDHTKAVRIADRTANGKTTAWYILTTSTVDWFDDGNSDTNFVVNLCTEASRLARYQCDRLASGLFNVWAAVGDYDQAQEKISELLYS